MSVWLQSPALSGSDGPLVSISVDVTARDLESLLEALARVSFPINPQIYHDAALVYRFPDGHEETEATTLVEFPAYAGQLNEVREVLASFGFDPARARVTDMLSEIHAEPRTEPALPGAPYTVRRRKSVVAATAGQIL